jgi:hypothetical protein
MFCYSAAGEMLPPMVVYASPTGGMFPDWCEGGPVGATYAATKNGWFTMEKHNQWFKQARVHTYTSTGTGNDTIPAHNGSNRYGT